MLVCCDRLLQVSEPGKEVEGDEIGARFSQLDLAGSDFWAIRSRSCQVHKGIGVLFGCFGTQIDGPGLPGGSIIYQGNPSISLKRTPMQKGLPFISHVHQGLGVRPGSVWARACQPISVPSSSFSARPSDGTLFAVGSEGKSQKQFGRQ